MDTEPTFNKEKILTTAEDVVDLCDALENLGIKIWIDGGWGVDALLGKQTRPHKDVDITIQEKDLARFREYLESHGYKEVERDEDKKWNFVLGDDEGHEVDVHAVVFDAEGNGIYGPVENGDIYPAASLTGIGMINGRTIQCISPEWLIKFHSGYELKEKDFKDVSALCERFGIKLPEEYIQFLKLSSF